MVKIRFGVLRLFYFLIFSNIIIGSVTFENNENFHAKVNDIIYLKPKFKIIHEKDVEYFEKKNWSFSYWDNYEHNNNDKGIGELGVSNSLFSRIGFISTPHNLERIPQKLIYSKIISLPFPTVFSLITSGFIGLIIIKRRK